MSKIERIIDYAQKFIGVPYIWGGEHPAQGFDCSGFVQEVLKSVGLDPRHDQTAQALHDHMYESECEPLDEKGAIVFFGRDLNRISHVALLLDSETMIEAGGGGSKTISKAAAIRDKAFVRIRPLKTRSDYLIALMPRY